MSIPQDLWEVLEAKGTIRLFHRLLRDTANRCPRGAVRIGSLAPEMIRNIRQAVDDRGLMQWISR
jgi:hypothetical protein